MKSDVFLIIITILFVVTGSFLLFSALNEYSFGGRDVCIVDGVEYEQGEKVIEYREGSECVCASGGLVECVPLSEKEELQRQSAIDVSDWDNQGLEFDYSYVVGLSETDTDFDSDVSFQDVRFEEDNLVVILEQRQSCPGSGNPPQQAGFYNKGENELSFYNMVRRVDEEEGIGCIVRLEYVLEDMGDSDLSEMELLFIDNLGAITSPDICFYNGNVYFDGDYFESEEDEVCVCENGEIKCE